MKNILIFIFVVSFVACNKGPAIDDQTYPWQIKNTPSGNTVVFGIELGKSPLGHAARTIKTRYELGLFENKQGQLSLEAYFNEVTKGGLSGRLIALLDVNQAQLDKFKTNSLKGKLQESGELKYLLTRDDQKLSEQFVIRSLSYIPYVNLDKEMIEKRFGMADEIIKSKDGLVHYIYLSQGLDIIQSEDGKEILQYVSPGDIGMLLDPLKDGKVNIQKQ